MLGTSGCSWSAAQLRGAKVSPGECLARPAALSLREPLPVSTRPLCPCWLTLLSVAPALCWMARAVLWVGFRLGAEWCGFPRPLTQLVSGGGPRWWSGCWAPCKGGECRSPAKYAQLILMLHSGPWTHGTLSHQSQELLQQVFVFRHSSLPVLLMAQLLFSSPPSSLEEAWCSASEAVPARFHIGGGILLPNHCSASCLDMP